MVMNYYNADESFHRPIADEHIDAALKMLDAHVPGWEQHIDLNELVMVEPQRCIVGQLRRKEIVQSRNVTDFVWSTIPEEASTIPEEADEGLARFHSIWDGLANYDDRWKEIIREKRGEK
jgi:hypothetical protein